jgi:hypothetical protein
MGKEFLRDCGQIRYCTSNFAKMSFIDFCKAFPNDCKPRLAWKEAIEGIGIFILVLIYLLTFPLSYPIILYIRIKIKIHRAKKEVKQSQQSKEVEND